MFGKHSMLKKAAVATAFLTIAPVVPMMTGGGPEAHTEVYVGAGISVASPIGVLGFSFGNPYGVGHVHRHAVACAHGPLYYYPAYGVYGHHAPRHAYYAYSGPVYGHTHRHHERAWHRHDYRPARFPGHRVRGHARGVKIRGHRH